MNTLFQHPSGRVVRWEHTLWSPLKIGTTIPVCQSRSTTPRLHAMLQKHINQTFRNSGQIPSTKEEFNHLSDLTPRDVWVVPFIPWICFLYRRSGSGNKEVPKVFLLLPNYILVWSQQWVTWRFESLQDSVKVFFYGVTNSSHMQDSVSVTAWATFLLACQYLSAAFDRPRPTQANQGQ